MNLAIRQTTLGWRVYEIDEDRFGVRAHVCRDVAGQILTFSTEEAARSFIEEIPDATEVEYPEELAL